MTDQARRNPFTLTLWVLAGLLLVVGAVLLIAGFGVSAPTEAFDEYDSSKGALLFKIGSVVATAGALLAGAPLAVMGLARELGVR